MSGGEIPHPRSGIRKLRNVVEHLERGARELVDAAMVR
jgi:hypothetical protein